MRRMRQTTCAAPLRNEFGSCWNYRPANIPMQLSKDLREFLECLNANEVEYLIVGAYAVAWHGYPRFTADLDILVRTTTANAERVLRSLAAFGFGSLGLTADDFADTDQIVQLGVLPNRIDLITSITGVTFDEAWEGRTMGDLEGIPVAFIGREMLIRNKEATGRARDVGDAEELKKRRG